MTYDASAATSALQRKIRAAAHCSEWRIQDVDKRTAMLVNALRILRAASVVSGLALPEIAANKRTIVSPEHAHERRVIRASIGVVARIYGVSPQAILLASGELLARGPITDGATWGARDGFDACRPTIEAIIRDLAETPANSEVREIAAALAKKVTAVAERPVQQEQSGALFSTAKGRHEDIRTRYVLVPQSE